MKSLVAKVVLSVAVSVSVTAALNYVAKKTGSNTKWTFMHIEL